MNTTYFSNLIMGNVFRSKTSPSIPTAYYVGLSKSLPTVGSTNVTEPSTGGYARVDITSLLGAPSNGEIVNNDDIMFPESSADWGTIPYYVVYDAPTGGNLLMFGTLSQSRVVEAATIVIIRTGELSLQLLNA